MQMEIVVRHDFTQLENIVERMFAVFGQLMQATGHPVQDNAPAPKLAAPKVDAPATVRDAVDASHGVARGPNPEGYDAAMAEKSPAPVEQPKRARGRPRKEKEAAAEMPARDVADNQPAPGTEATYHATDPLHKAAPAIPGFDDEAETAPTPEEIKAFKTAATELSGIEGGGDRLYLDIRASHGNPRVVDMKRKVFDAFRADVEAALKDPKGFAAKLAAKAAA